MKRWIKNCLVTGGALLVGGMALSAVGALLGGKSYYQDRWEEAFGGPFGFYNGFGLWGSGADAEYAREEAVAVAVTEAEDQEATGTGPQVEQSEDEVQTVLEENFPQGSILTRSFEIAPFEELNVDNNRGDLMVRQGDRWQMEVENLKGDFLQIGEQDGVLEVTYQVPEQLSQDHNGEKMVLTIPKGVQLSSVNVSSGLGDTWLGGFAAQELRASSEVGDLEMEEVDTDSLDLTCGVGKIQGRQLRVRSSLSVTDDVGEVELEGEMTGELYLQSGVGGVSLKLQNASYEDYNYTVENNMGEVQVGENHRITWPGSWGAENQEAESDLTIECDVGEIRVEFER